MRFKYKSKLGLYQNLRDHIGIQTPEDGDLSIRQRFSSTKKQAQSLNPSFTPQTKTNINSANVNLESDRHQYTGSLKKRYGHTPAQVNKSAINPFTIPRVEVKHQLTQRETKNSQPLGGKNPTRLVKTPRKGNEHIFDIEHRISEEGNNSCDVTQSQDIKILESEEEQVKTRVQKKGSQHYISLQQDPFTQLASVKKQAVPILPISSHNLNRLSLQSQKAQNKKTSKPIKATILTKLSSKKVKETSLKMHNKTVMVPTSEFTLNTPKAENFDTRKIRAEPYRT
jgi:hypothetical protein